ncbi:MAG: DegV family protein [Anaerolineaceae bacterium]|nr:DegV family protein [Anaerolineaceae bacterium]
MTNKKIALLTDSTNDLPQEYLDQYNIHVIPLSINWGAESYKEGIEITKAEFYQRLRKDHSMPKTSQPAPGDFLKFYKQFKDEQFDEALVITISSGMSGTYQSALQASEESDLPVTVIDSRSNTMGLGWQVLAAARELTSGTDVQEIPEKLEQIREKLRLYVQLNTLEYLHKGGRIGSATRFIGELVQLKPLVLVNNHSGLVEGSKRSRTWKRALDTVYKTFIEGLDITKPMKVAVLHADDEESALKVAERIKNEINVDEFVFTMTSPILGTHTGPGTVAIAGYPIN